MLLATACDGEPPWAGPRTEAELSDYERTSTSEQVRAFVAACAARSPRLHVARIGTTTEGRPLEMVLAADPPVASLAAAAADARPKVVVMANIHAGEVEGKEAVQIILREIARGGHADVLRRVVVAFLPNYNPDGNDRIDRRNRPDQAGPVQGVGVRHNAMTLDLNRDYVKVEAPETEALLRATRAVDAALVVDLHATNGSFHGFDLTYAGPLHPASDPGLLSFVRDQFLPEFRQRMRRRGFETFDYGNWVDEARPESGWATFEGLPRYGNSYFGLRNRLTLLSEAYSHDPFEKRIRVTHALVIEGLAIVAERGAQIRGLVADADRAAAALAGVASLPTATRLARTMESHPVPVGGVREEKDPVTGLVRQWDTDRATPVAMPVFAWFDGAAPRAVPAGWIIPRPDARLRRLLDVHGIAAEELGRDRVARVEVFDVDSQDLATRPFQGHRLRTLRGTTRTIETPIARGALYVTAAQPMARLAFVLLEAESEDGFVTWGIAGADPTTGGGARFSILRHRAWVE